MRKILLYLILLLAICLAGTVAYVSVTGLMKVFTGSGTVGLVFFIIIEVAKVIATSAIHTYGKMIKWYYRLGLTLCIIFSMMVTSIGIYGFLSSSYKSSFAEMETVNAKIELLETKKDGYQNQLNVLNEEKISLNNTISELTKGLANNVIQYKDQETGQIITTTSSSTRKALEKQLENAQVRLTEVNTKSDSLSNVIFDLDNEILEVKLNNNAAEELSTLKYLSDITGKSMDDVMGWLMFILIVLGDPMAVLMVILFNKVVSNTYNNNDLNELPKYSKVTNKHDIETVIDNHFEDTNIHNHINDEVKSDIITHNEDVDEYFKNIDGEKFKEEDIIEPEPSVTTNEVINEDIIELEQDVLEKVEEDSKPEEQLTENKWKIKETIGNFKKIAENVKLPPVIKTGKVKREDIKEIKEQEGTRGYSVNVPEPKDGVIKVGTNKEFRNSKPNTLFFNRRNP